MPRTTFDQELQTLQDEMLVLGNMVEHAIQEAVEALKHQDEERAKGVIALDRSINERRFAIENDCLVLIATQQPMARDLRVLAAVLEIVGELERIGDYAKGIGNIVLRMGKQPLVKPLIDIPLMAEKTTSMLRRALDAFIRRDLALARAIPREDDEVDNLYNQVYRELVAIILENPRTMDQANYLLWAAHNLERAADRVTNICERTVFTITGRMLEVSDEAFYAEQ
jgi:phosphate transport system protein